MIVTEAFGGTPGAAASSYARTEPVHLSPVSGSVADTRSEVCWAVVTSDGRFAFVTNFGDGTISSYAIADDGSIELHNPVAGTTRLGEKAVRDEAITRDGRYLYATYEIGGWPETDLLELSASVGRSRSRPAALPPRLAPAPASASVRSRPMRSPVL